MKQVYVLRHGEKDPDNPNGLLTERGERAARALRDSLPTFTRVYSSGVPRAMDSARLMTGVEPIEDARASFATAPPEVSAAIIAIVKERGISFWDAAHIYGDQEVLAGVAKQAGHLKELVDGLLALPDDGPALIVSHDLTIVPMALLYGMSGGSIGPLDGYVVSRDDDGISVVRFVAPQFN